MRLKEALEIGKEKGLSNIGQCSWYLAAHPELLKGEKNVEIAELQKDYGFYAREFGFNLETTIDEGLLFCENMGEKLKEVKPYYPERTFRSEEMRELSGLLRESVKEGPSEYASELPSSEQTIEAISSMKTDMEFGFRREDLTKFREAILKNLEEKEKEQSLSKFETVLLRNYRDGVGFSKEDWEEIKKDDLKRRGDILTGMDENLLSKTRFRLLCVAQKKILNKRKRRLKKNRKGFKKIRVMSYERRTQWME